MKRTRRQVLGVLLGLPLGGCIGEAQQAPFAAAPSRISARRQLEDLGARYEALMRSHGELALRTGHGPESSPALLELKGRELSLMGRAERLLEYHEALLPPALARSWQLGALGLRLFDDAETRKLEEALAVAQVSPAEVNREPLERARVDELLHSRRPEERDIAKAALEGLQARCAPIARELLLRRRARARELGEDYYETALRIRRVKLSRLEQLAQAFVRGTDDETRSMARSLTRILRRGVGRRRGAYAANDLEFALDRLAPLPEVWFPAARGFGVARKLVTTLGFDADVSSPEVLRANSPYQCPGESMSVPLAIPDDIRLVVAQARGIAGWRACLAELARTIELTRTQEAEALLKGYPWIPGLADPAFDRGFAGVFASLLGYPEVLEEYGKVSARVTARAAQSQRMRRLFGLRQTVAWMTFERRALGNPKQDLNRLAGQVYARLTGVNHPVYWAADPRLVVCPGGEPTVLIGELFAASVHSWLRADGSPHTDPPRLGSDTGRRLAAAFLSVGVSRSIDEKLLAAQGERLSARHIVNQLTRHRARLERPIML